MNRLLQAEFDIWYQDRDYSKEADEIYSILASSATEHSIADKWQQMFMNAIEIEQSAAFEKGFYTAVELLTKGGQQ